MGFNQPEFTPPVAPHGQLMNNLDNPYAAPQPPTNRPSSMQKAGQRIMTPKNDGAFVIGTDTSYQEQKAESIRDQLNRDL